MVIGLDEYPCKVLINCATSEINIQAQDNVQLLKKMSEIVKKSFKLI